MNRDIEQQLEEALEACEETFKKFLTRRLVKNIPLPLPKEEKESYD